MKYKLVLEFEAKHPKEDLWRSEIASLIEDAMETTVKNAQNMYNREWNIYKDETVKLEVRVA